MLLCNMAGLGAAVNIAAGTATARVRLFAALGGGFDDTPPMTTAGTRP